MTLFLKNNSHIDPKKIKTIQMIFELNLGELQHLYIENDKEIIKSLSKGGVKVLFKRQNLIDENESFLKRIKEINEIKYQVLLGKSLSEQQIVLVNAMYKKYRKSMYLTWLLILGAVISLITIIVKI